MLMMMMTVNVQQNCEHFGLGLESYGLGLGLATSGLDYIPAAMSLSCTIYEILSLISQNLKRSRESEHILWGNISCLHLHSCVSISTRYL